MARSGTATKSEKRRAPVSADGWRRCNDAGPHVATFPSGAVLKFVIPDSGALLRAGKLPERLRKTALYCAAHPDGPEGFMLELITAGMLDDERKTKVDEALVEALELEHILVAEMLVEPEVTAGEVGQGEFPELDVKMLLEFAERRRNVDAAGTKLPITLLSGWASFRSLEEGDGGAGNGAANGHDDPGAVPDADDRDV